MSQPVVYRYAPARWGLLIVAVLIFLLAAFHANPIPSIDLIPLGLALGFGAFLVP